MANVIRAAAVPMCMEFIHRTRRPFHLIAVQIKTFSASVAVGIEVVKPLNLIRTLQLRHLSQLASGNMSFDHVRCRIVDEALQSADFNITYIYLFQVTSTHRKKNEEH